MSRDQRAEDVKLARSLLGTDRFTTKVNAATQDLLACLRQAPRPLVTAALIRQARERKGRQVRVGVNDLPHGMKARSGGAADSLDSILNKLEGVIYGSAVWEMRKKGLLVYRDGKVWRTTPGGNRQPRQRQRRRVATQPA